MCRSLLPVIVVRPRHMKFFVRRGSDQWMRVENTGIQRRRESSPKKAAVSTRATAAGRQLYLSGFVLLAREGRHRVFLSVLYEVVWRGRLYLRQLQNCLAP